MENKNKIADEKNWKKLSEGTYLIFITLIMTRFFPLSKFGKSQRRLDNSTVDVLNFLIIIGILFIIIINLIHWNDPKFFEKKD